MKRQLQNLLSIVILIFASSTLFGQGGITMSEDTVSIPLGESYGYDAIFFTNETDETVECAISFDVLCLNAQDEMQAQICFGDLCFAYVNEDIVWGDTGPSVLVYLEPGETSGRFKFTTINEDGFGSSFKISIFDRNNPETRGEFVIEYGPECIPTSSTDFLLDAEDFVVYPNPARESISVKTPKSSETYTLKVYNIIGRQILDSKITNEAIDISSLTAGIYTYQIVSNRKATKARKLMVK